MTVVLILLAKRHGGWRKLWGKHGPNATVQSAEYVNSEAFALQDERERQQASQDVLPTETTDDEQYLMPTGTTDTTHQVGPGHDADKPEGGSTEY